MQGALIFIIAGVAGYGLGFPVYGQLVRWNALDYPNSRSSHDRPTARGAGVAIIITILLITPLPEAWSAANPRAIQPRFAGQSPRRRPQSCVGVLAALVCAAAICPVGHLVRRIGGGAGIWMDRPLRRTTDALLRRFERAFSTMDGINARRWQRGGKSQSAVIAIRWVPVRPISPSGASSSLRRSRTFSLASQARMFMRRRSGRHSGLYAALALDHRAKCTAGSSLSPLPCSHWLYSDSQPLLPGSARRTMARSSSGTLLSATRSCRQEPHIRNWPRNGVAGNRSRPNGLLPLWRNSSAGLHGQSGPGLMAEFFCLL